MGQGLKLPGCSSKTEKPAAAKNGSLGSGKPAAGSGKDGGASQKGGAKRCFDVPQMSIEEALAIYQALKVAFGDESFQKRLRRLEALHPKRGLRAHADQQNFAVQLHDLLVGVYKAVLPRKPWSLAPGWEGYRQLLARTASIAEEPRMIRAREEINAVLGLPRQTVLRPPAEEPVFVPVYGEVTSARPEYDRPLIQDADGDFAHEFWIEDAAGNLRRVLPPPVAAT